MRRRSFALTLPLGLLALSACDTGADGDAEDTAGPEGEPTTPPDVTVDPEPIPIGELAEPVDATELRLPLEMTVMIVVDPGWTSAPLERDGIFLGYSEEGGRLRFIAADQDGTLLWEVQRPLSCTGFALSADADGRAIAVLADTAADGSAAEGQPAMTMTGYDLRTAERLWGPTEVPGPPSGQGLVFAAPGDQPAGGESPSIALDPATGATALAEEDLGGGRVLAEDSGTIIRTDGQDLVALAAADAAELWRIAMPAGLDPQQARIQAPVAPGTGLAVLGDEQGSGVLLDLSDGRVVAEEVERAAHDHALDITVVVAGHVVRGLEPEGLEAWRHEDPEELELLSAGERLAYAQRPQEGTLVVLDTSQGVMVHPYDADLSGPLGVPEVFSADAAAAVNMDGPRYLVTTALDEEFGMR